MPFEITMDELIVNQFNLEQCSVKGEFKNMALYIPTITAKIYEGELSSNATLNFNNPEAPDFTFNAYISDLNIETFALRTKLFPSGYKGILDSEITLKGTGLSPEKIKASAQLSANLEKASANEIPLENVHAAARAEYINNNLEIKELQLLYKTIIVTSKGSISSVLKNPILDIFFNTALELADISLLPITLPVNLKDLNLTGKVNAQAEVKGPIQDLTSLETTAKLICEKMGIKNVFFENVNLNGNLSSKILTMTASANSYSGTITANADADFLDRDFKYKSSLQIKEVDIGRLIKESKIIPQQHQGILSFTADAAGLGTSPNTITGKANILLVKGRFAGVGILKLIGSALNIPFLGDLDITQANGDFTLQNALVSTENAKITGPDVVISVKGGAEIITQAFKNLAVNLALTPEGSKKTSNAVLDNFFIYKDDLYQRDIYIEGTITKPEINREKLMGDLAKQQIQKGIEKIFQKEPAATNENAPGQPAGNTAQEQLQKGVEKILEKGLKGLFGK